MLVGWMWILHPYFYFSKTLIFNAVCFEWLQFVAFADSEFFFSLDMDVTSGLLHIVTHKSWIFLKKAPRNPSKKRSHCWGPVTQKSIAHVSSRRIACGSRLGVEKIWRLGRFQTCPKYSANGWAWMKNIQNQDIHDSFRFLVFKFFVVWTNFPAPFFQDWIRLLLAGGTLAEKPQWAKSLELQWRRRFHGPHVLGVDGCTMRVVLLTSRNSMSLYDDPSAPEVSTMRSIHLSGPTFTVALWVLAGFCPAAQGRCCSRHGASCGIQLQNVDLIEVNLVYANESWSITESLGLAYTMRNFNQFQRISNSSILHLILTFGLLWIIAS